MNFTVILGDLKAQCRISSYKSELESYYVTRNKMCTVESDRVEH